MTRTDHLLWILAEECNEVAQRASKAARFGLGEIQPGQPLTNAERLMGEFAELTAAMKMLLEEDRFSMPEDWDLEALADKKAAKVEKFLLYSKECGRLDHE